MIEALAELTPLIQAWLWAGFAVFCRVGIMMFLLPAFGEAMVPARVRLALGFAFAAVLLPVVQNTLPPAPQVPMQVVGFIASEALAGALFGMLLRLFVLGLQVVGTIAGQSTSLSQIFGGTAGVDPAPAMGRVLVLGGLAFATLSGLHLRFVDYMVTGYILIPPGDILSAEALAQIGLDQVTHCFALGFTLAAPFLVASLIYNVTLGVINRAMPQLMVAFVGAPAITAGGLALLALCAPIILTLWWQALEGFMLNPARPGP